MNGQERIEAAFSPEGTPEIPAVICYEGIFVRDHWSQLSSDPWWIRHSFDIERQSAWRRQVVEAISQDWFALPLGPSYDERAHLSIRAHEGAAYMVDDRTGERRLLATPRVGGWPEHGIASVHPTLPPATPEEVDAWLDDREMTTEQPAEGCLDLPRMILSTWGGTLYPLSHVPAPLWLCYRMWGFEGLMTRIVDQPHLVRYAVERLTERALRQVRVSAMLGAKGIWIEDCLTDMIGPHQFRMFNLPYLRQLAAEIRALDMHSIYYYCGDPAGKWDLLLETGSDALSLEESKKGFAIDIEEVVERVNGRMVVLGNLDAMTLLEQGSEDELRGEIARQIAAGRRNGSRFVTSLGSPVTPDTPVSRARLYCELAHWLGKE